MLVPSLDGPRNPTMDDVKRAADEYNKMGEQSAKAGIQQGLHNEDFELTTVDGKRTYDMLLDLLDPKLVKFQFQVSTISHGYDAAEYFTKYPGRFISMHVQGWSAETKKIMAGGTGHSRLEEDLYRGENGRHQELLRRNEPGHDEGQRSLPSRSAGLMDLLAHSCGGSISGRRQISWPLEKLLAVGNPDVLHLNGMLEEPAAFSLFGIEPVDLAALVRKRLL